MRLSYLLKDCTPLWERSFAQAFGAEEDPEIRSIHSDSRFVKPGGLFIAIKGFQSDGHDYISQAQEKGAAAVISERSMVSDKRVVVVNSGRKAMASIAARFYGMPSEKLNLTGITGTNGKTTTTWILESILKKAGHVTGVIGTVNWRYGGNTHDNPVTTPESLDLQRMLKEMLDAGVTHVIMEVSSHGIDLHRVRNCSFDVAVFTNLSQDHLDYHKTLKRYFLCKKRLFTKLLTKGPKADRSVAVLNLDDERGNELAQSVKTKQLSFSTRMPADVKSEDITQKISGISGRIRLPGTSFPISSGLTGRFNLENLLAAAGAAHALGIPNKTIQAGIKSCSGVPGRLERVALSSKRYIFVDYAHTPDALDSILNTLKPLAPERVITVFGCGGDRDRTKRSAMGSIAAALSNLAVITSDNPRSEKPSLIINDILQGVAGVSNRRYLARELDNGFEEDGFHVEPDRKKALRLAVTVSRPGDIILAAGKGHETYQILKDGTIDFDDAKVLEEAVLDLGFTKEVSHA